MSIPGSGRRSATRAIASAAAIALAIAAISIVGCRSGAGEPDRPTRTAEAVLESHRDSLFSIPGVKGTGVTDWRDEAVIVVIVEDRKTAAVDRIPDRLEGHRVLVVDEEEVRRLGGI